VNYYNDTDQFAVAWLRELIAAGALPAGDVDARSIVDVRPDDLARYTQCHFFAGIGGWSYALQLAAWPVERAVWTGSCPCQPFSAAGLQRGIADDRHLWPAWYRLIRECRPAVIFGEQVEAAIGHGWLDAVCDDLEREGYAVAACGLPAASIGAPHGRHRLWFVADTDWVRRDGVLYERGADVAAEGSTTARDRDARDVGDANDAGSQGRCVSRNRADQCAAGTTGVARGDTGFWNAADWLACSDGQARPVESGTFPLAHGVSARVGRLRGYGNAIVPQVAAAVIAAYLALEQEG
jgi:DNA (cytosine-5)-methyltransferase 1